MVSTHLKNISQNWIISPGKGENKKYLKPPSKYDLSIRYENPWSLLPLAHLVGVKVQGGSTRAVAECRSMAKPPPPKIQPPKIVEGGATIRELRKSGWEHILKLGWVITSKFWLWHRIPNERLDGFVKKARLSCHISWRTSVKSDGWT